MTSFYKNSYALLEGIEDCLKMERIMPCLALIYVGIDVMASTDKKSGEGTRDSFERWVGRYMIGGKQLPCSATDLYAARCGILHTFTAESDLSQKHKAKIITYAWGAAESEQLQRATTILNESYLCIHLRDLIDVFRSGIKDYLIEVEQDEQRRSGLEAKAGLWLAHLETTEVENFLKIQKNEEPSRNA